MSDCGEPAPEAGGTSAGAWHVNDAAMAAWPSNDAAMAASWSRYENRLRRVVAHVHAHLDEPLDLMRLADIACLSAHHWHRVYHGVYGETLASTVKRLRMQRAAADLANTTLPVAQVGRRAGYPSLASFNRLFKAAYGLPPARYRAQGAHAPFRMAAHTGAATEGTAAYDAPAVQVLALPSMDLLAVDHQGDYLQIGQAFDLLFGRLAAGNLARPGMRIVALYHDDPAAVPKPKLRSLAGAASCAPGEITPPLRRMQTVAGRYAVLRYRGSYASMHAAYRWLFGHWLPRSGFDPADAPVIEEYLNNPRDTAPADLLTLICLPLAEG